MNVVYFALLKAVDKTAIFFTVKLISLDANFKKSAFSSAVSTVRGFSACFALYSASKFLDTPPLKHEAIEVFTANAVSLSSSSLKEF